MIAFGMMADNENYDKDGEEPLSLGLICWTAPKGWGLGECESSIYHKYSHL